MQNYLQKGRFPAWADGMGLRTVIMLAGVGWFVYLWGLGAPAVLAGCALGIMGQLALTQYRRRTVDRREEALRQRIGGELFLEEMLLAPARQAHFQTALLLGARYPLTMERVTEEGMLCQSEGETLLVACLPLPESCEAGLTAVAALQRACRRYGASRGVLCVTGKVAGKTEAWAAEGAVPVRIISRDVLLDLAGRAFPATDEQLIHLGKRKKRPVPAVETILRRDKAKTYLVYGTGLMLLYVVTGLLYYPGPGAVCLALAVMCRCRRVGPEKL